jgi:DNA topoisomerase-1
MLRASHTRAVRGPHRDIAPDSPQWFTADGQRKWKVPPAGVRLEKNTARHGTWIERWEAPRRKGDTGPVTWVYNYTLKEVQRRAGIKFAQNRELARRLPALRAKVQKDLDGTGKTQQLAMVVRLMDKLGLRVGSMRSAVLRKHYGATTLKRDDVEVAGDTVKLNFIAKSGKPWKVSLNDAKLARAIAQQPDREDGRLFDVSAADVNEYLKPFGATAKMLRTFQATQEARKFLLRHKDTPPEQRQAVIAAMYAHNSGLLHHSAAVDRESYVDPMVPRAFMKGKLA